MARGLNTAFVEPSADEQAELLRAPLVLEEAPDDVRHLVHLPAQTEVPVGEVVVVVLHTCGQLGGHEEQAVHVVGVLSARDERPVVGGSVGVELPLCSEIGLAGDILGGGIEGPFVARVGREDVESQASAVYRIVELFGDDRLVRRPVEHLLAVLSDHFAASSELVDVVVFGCEFGAEAGAVITPEAYRFRLDAGNVRKVVAVMVVRRAFLHHAEDIHAGFVVVGDECASDGSVDVEFAVAEDIRDVGDVQGVVEGLLGDDVYDAADGVGSVEGRAAPAYHLHPLYHGDGKLVEAVDRGQRTEYRAAVEQYL